MAADRLLRFFKKFQKKQTGETNIVWGEPEKNSLDTASHRWKWVVEEDEVDVLYLSLGLSAVL